MLWCHPPANAVVRRVPIQTASGWWVQYGPPKLVELCWTGNGWLTYMLNPLSRISWTAGHVGSPWVLHKMVHQLARGDRLQSAACYTRLQGLVHEHPPSIPAVQYCLVQQVLMVKKPCGNHPIQLALKTTCCRFQSVWDFFEFCGSIAQANKTKVVELAVFLHWNHQQTGTELLVKYLLKDHSDTFCMATVDIHVRRIWSYSWAILQASTCCSANAVINLFICSNQKQKGAASLKSEDQLFYLLVGIPQVPS